jgi:hypothetical protein
MRPLDGEAFLISAMSAGRPFQFWMAVLFTTIPLIFFLGLLATMVLSFRGQISHESATLLLFVLLVLNLLSRMPHARILKAYLSSRPESFLRAFPNLTAKAVGLEEGRTYKKTKFVIEDSGVCLMDPERHRVLIEGCQYRYVFYAKDIRSVEPVSAFSLGGARLTCRVGEHELVSRQDCMCQMKPTRELRCCRPGLMTESSWVIIPSLIWGSGTLR